VQEQFSLNSNHPILKNHKVFNQELLPGLAYIDMLYQIFREHGYDYTSLELRNLTIYNPLIVEQHYDVMLSIQCTESRDGQWQIRVEGQEKHNETLVPDKKLYITAEMHQREDVVFEEMIDINSIKESAAKIANIDEAYEKYRHQGLVHTGFMKAEGLIYDTGTSLIGDISIGHEAHFNAEGFMFHPTLIDGSGIAAEILLSPLIKDKQQLFLPLFYQSFCASALLTKQCVTRIQTSSVRQEKELVYLTMEFFNESGKKTGELKNFVGKLVRNTNLKNQQAKIGIQEIEPTFILPQLPVTYSDNTAPSGEVELFLQQLLGDRLKKPGDLIETTVGYYEMGLDSARLLDIVHQIETRISATLSPTLLFEYTTISELAAYIAENYASEFGLQTAATREIQKQQVVGDPLAVDNFDSSTRLSLKSNTYTFSGHEAFLQDHLVFGKPALMGITHPCLVLETYIQNNPESFPVELKNVTFTGGPVTLREMETAHIEVQFVENENQAKFQTVFYVTDPHSIKSCCRGEYSKARFTSPGKIDIGEMIGQSKPLDKKALNKLYQGIKDFTIGPMLKTIDAAYVYNDSTLISKVSLSGKLEKGNVSRFLFDPLLLNSCYYIYQKDNEEPKSNIFVPLMIKSLTIHRPMTETAYVLTTTRLVKDDFISFDANIVTEEGEIIATLVNASLKEVVNPSLLTNASFEIPAAICAAKAKVKTANTVVQEEKPPALDIAIIGVAGRYPQAYDVEKFWEILQKGKDCITEIPKERWDWHDYYTEDRTKPGHIYSKWGGFIDDVDRFDPMFFNISPREAEMLDPQERLFLEHCWKGLEDAGYTREKLQNIEDPCTLGQVGVYVGVMSQEYPLFAAEANNRGQQFGLNAGIAAIANRVSYFFDSHGPSIAIDTMCSSSLTCIYMACQALKDKDINVALVGGVNVTIHPNKYLLLSQGQFISSKGHCESFGEGGDGYIPGEGVGVLVLKRLADAKRDNDNIHAVIKGVAINHGGRASGFTVPNQKAQSRVVASALKVAQINPRIISYLEAHGTGTFLGDPIEIIGLTKAFRDYTKDNQYCAIGSAKSNIGHCESAAGIAGITKVLLQLKHRQLVPSLHSKTLNPNIDFASTPFLVQQELVEWKRPVVTINGETREYPRIAGVSSFGAGGSNAHVVIEEYIQDQEKNEMIVTAKNPVIFVLSARNEDRLKEQARQLLAAIRTQQFSDRDLVDMAYTLQVGREAMEERLAMTAVTIQELEKKLQGYLDGRDTIEKFFRGQVKSNKDTLAIFTADEDLQKAIEAWIVKGKYVKLLDLWVKGLSFDWNKLYNNRKPQRITLPTYPFARERYWISKMDTKKPSESAIALMLENPIQSEIPKHSLHSLKVTSAISTVQEKPSGVTLLSLSDTQKPLYQAKEQKQLEVTLQAASILPSTCKSSDEPKPVVHVQATISVEALREELKISLAEVLRMKQDDVDVDIEFVNMGLDSVTGVEWIQAINKQYGISIQTTRIYDYPSIAKMANYLVKKLPERKEEIIQESPLKSTSTFSLNEILHQVKSGVIDGEEAELLLTKVMS
jgi:3-oxoacyl-(acyl-carrier-protein) synthase/acyl carrier protein